MDLSTEHCENTRNHVLLQNLVEYKNLMKRKEGKWVEGRLDSIFVNGVKVVAVNDAMNSWL